FVDYWAGTTTFAFGCGQAGVIGPLSGAVDHCPQEAINYNSDPTLPRDRQPSPEFGAGCFPITRWLTSTPASRDPAQADSASASNGGWAS
ncbi:MAG: hypothetical protein QG573_138, partial [Acidobacteriota bacterium]|nr:hypothetical protein [Acidobacteriota bacterium]